MIGVGNAMLNIRRKFTGLSFLVWFSASPTVYAVDINYNIAASLARFDNINRVSNPTQDETVETLTGNLVVSENTANLVLNMNAGVSAINYQNNLQQDRTIYNLNLNSLWIIKPRHFEWMLSDVYTQSVIDPLQNNTQSNRQDVNALNTGPNYYWRLNARNNINLQARYGKVDFENSAGDNERFYSAVRWIYLANSALSLSLNSEAEKLDFKNNSINDYVRSSLYLGANYVRGRNTLEAQAGLTKLDSDSRGSTTGQRYLLAIQNQRTNSSFVRLDYSKGITDSGSQLLSTAGSTGTTQTLANTLSTDVLTLERLTASYNKTLRNGAFFISLNKSTLEYENQITFDQESQGGNIRYTYNFSPISFVDFQASRTDTRFKNFTPVREDTLYRYRINYTYNTSRSLTFSLRFETTERESTDTSNKFKNNGVTASVTYTSR